MYRFPVENIENYYNFVQKNGVIPVKKLQKIQFEQIARAMIFAVKSVDGVWIEFYEKIKI
jgi:hypothetical protein